MADGEWEHQCRRPWIWSARLRGSRIGRRWTCLLCGRTWRLGYMRFPMIPGAPLIMEWQEEQS